MSQFLVRMELHHGDPNRAGIKVGWRICPPLTRENAHGVLCALMSLDPSTYYFDLPTTALGTGSAVSGAGGLRGSRLIDGYIMRGGSDTPVGKLVFCREGEKFRDEDPRSLRDQLRLGEAR